MIFVLSGVRLLGVIPDDIYITVRWRRGTLVQIILNSVSDEPRSNPAIWQAQGVDHPEDVPPKRVGPDYLPNLGSGVHDDSLPAIR